MAPRGVRWGPMKRSPPSSSVRPVAPRREAVSPPRRHSSSVQRHCRQIGQAPRRAAAAEAEKLARAPQAAAALVAIAADGPLDALEQARALRLRGEIGLDLRHGRETVTFLLDAARALRR